MTLFETFEAIVPSVVALGYLTESKAPFGAPKIVGTGFVIDSRGLVVTAGHVAKCLQSSQLPIFAMPYLQPRLIEGKVEAEAEGILLPVAGCTVLEDYKMAGEFFAEQPPDLAVFQLGVCDVPSLSIDNEPNVIRPGVSVAYCGYPFGVDGLILDFDDAPSPISVQMMPYLRHGIVSSVHPFPCPRPHGFTIDAMSQGGASGSPIFLSDRPAVIGLLYGAVTGTNLTFAVPSAILAGCVPGVLQKPDAPKIPNRTLAQFLAHARDKNANPAPRFVWR